MGNQSIKNIRQKIREWKYRNKANFILYGVINVAILAFAFSFTSFTLKGAYFPLLVSVIITQTILYNFMKKSGNLDKYRKRKAEDKVKS